MAFSSIIGQNEAKKRLGTALRGTPGHAYIFAGPDGIGKTTLAREFAKDLLCPSATPDGACGSCPSCRYFDHQVHPDFRHLQIEDKDKVIKVERVRQSVTGDLYLRPQLGDRKVYLIDADALNEQGQNALLKSLEEPPDYAFFLLTIIGPERLLPTILSRMNLIALRRYDPAEIEAILAANGLEAGEEKRFYARFAGGLAGVAMDLAGSGWFADLRQETLQFYETIGSQSRTALLTAGYQFFESNRPHVPVILDILGSLVRDQLVLDCAADPGLITNQDQLPLLRKVKAKLPTQEARYRLVRSYAALLAARRGLSLNVSFESLICNLLLNFRKEFAYA
jgi:DNA polymerase III subunit delta'